MIIFDRIFRYNIFRILSRKDINYKNNTLNNTLNT